MSTGRSGAGTSKSKADDIELLLKRIEEQNEQITRLQTKFRDVTHAYKSLLAEKKALEITIKALQSKNKPNNVAASSSQSDVSESESRSANGLSADQQLKKVQEDASNEEKIAALTANIQLVLENKAHLEASYQAEKKKLRAEIDEFKSKFETYRQEAKKVNESNELRIKELKASLKNSHSERDNLTMELNSMIKIKQADQENKVLSIQEESQTLLFNYRNENNDLKTKIKNLTKQFENKCEELIQCENEFKKFKALREEQLKTDEVELANLRNQLREQEKASEKRVGDLELRIAQLCSTIANYDNTTLNTSTNLNPNNSEGTTPVKTPLKVKSIENEMAELNLKSSDKMDFDSAVEQLSHLKSYIESTARELNLNFNFNEIWSQSGELNSKLEKDKQKEIEKENEKLKDENRQLKEEYEKFKIRTNYLIKTAKLNKEPDAASENVQHTQQQQITKLKEEIDGLKRRLHGLKQEKEEESREEKEKHEREISDLRAELRLQAEKAENERAKSVADLELELRKQRERTIKLLGEKDAEIEQLNAHHQHMRAKSVLKAVAKVTPTISTAAAVAPNDDSSAESNGSSLADMNNGGEQTPHQSPSLTAVSSAAANAHLIFDMGDLALGGDGSSSSPASQQSYMLYYNQQLAYKDSELNKLRAGKSDLEYKMKQVVDEHSVEVERMQAQIGLLKDEIERGKLNAEREALNRENLEYVKNVVFNYMTTRDPNVRASMINAIIQILKFTKNEKVKLNQMLASNNNRFI